MVFLLKERLLKRKNGEKFVHIAPDILDAILLPCPNLRRNIIIDRNTRLGMNKLGYRQVKAGIINEYDHIRMPFHDILLAERHVTENGWKMQQYRHKAHIGKILVVSHHCPAFSSHQVATEKTELRIFIVFPERLHQT